MKHLRKFNESKELPLSIEDILLDITDLGYLSKVEHVLWTKVEGESRNTSCKITIYNKKFDRRPGTIDGMCIDDILNT